eukprot:TRINITY_DN26214_c0_g1_i1.p1 TRINITY_DN26214_c0_g1~~TRINITY_DN26214_c0_g1_i1.p1  ORF type:complete len:910 (+),score=84.93 TRINITY_DN26214_c0_g1_i1:66-2795(+)
MLATFAAWIATQWHGLQRHGGIFGTLTIDSCWFLLCLCLCFARSWLGRRQRATREQASKGSLIEPLALADEDVEPACASPKTRGSLSGKQPLTPTALIYLAFLDNGMTLFLVLFAVSLCVVPWVWPLFGLDGVTSMVTMEYNTTSQCLPGFPLLGSSSPFNCTGPVFDSPIFTEHRRQPNDPRPSGNFRANATFDECAVLASVCRAPAIAYGMQTTFDVKGDVPQGECWLLQIAPQNESGSTLEPFADFFTCIGVENSTPGTVAAWLTVIYGIVVLVFSHRFLRVLKSISSSTRSDLERCSVWLTGLPTHDACDGSAFQLTADEFCEVEDVLKESISAHIDSFPIVRRDPELRTEQKVLAVHVAVGSGSGSGLVSRRRLAGSAFVTLSREGYASLLLMRRQSLPWLGCLQSVQDEYLKFGRPLLKFGKPPFSSVTLRCKKAPPPSDLVWSNMQYRKGPMKVFSYFLEMMVIAMLLVFVAPASFVTALGPVVDALCRRGLMIEQGFCEARLTSLVQQLPSYLVLLVNSAIVPNLVAFVASARRPKLTSDWQMHQLHSMAHILLLNSLVVPLIGVVASNESILDRLLHLFVEVNQGPDTDVVRNMSAVGTYAQWSLILKYLVNATFITNGNQLIHLTQRFCRLTCGCCYPAKGNLEFPWGYWCGWSISVLCMSLAASVILPCMLPLAAFFFAMTHWVHKRNLERPYVFKLTPHMEPSFGFMLVSLMIRSVAFFWWLMALFFMTQNSYLGEWSFTVPVLECTIVRLPTRLRLVVGFALLTLLTGVITWVFERDGCLETWLWGWLGERRHQQAIVLLRLLVLALLVTETFLLLPSTHWHVQYRKVPLHLAIALLLIGSGALVMLVSLLTLTEGKRIFLTEGLLPDAVALKAYPPHSKEDMGGYGMFARCEMQT